MLILNSYQWFLDQALAGQLLARRLYGCGLCVAFLPLLSFAQPALAQDEDAVAADKNMQQERVANTNPDTVQSSVLQKLNERYIPTANVPAPRRRLYDTGDSPKNYRPIAQNRDGSDPSSGVRIWGQPVSDGVLNATTDQTQRQLQELEDVKSTALRLSQEKVSDYPIRPRRLEPLPDAMPKAFIAEPTIVNAPIVAPPATASTPAPVIAAIPPIVAPIAETKSQTMQAQDRSAEGQKQDKAADLAKGEQAAVVAKTVSAPQPSAVDFGMNMVPPATASTLSAAGQAAAMAKPLAPAETGGVKAANSGEVKSAGVSATTDTAQQNMLSALSASGDDIEFIKKLVGNNGIIAMDVSQASTPPDVQDAIRIEEAVAFALKNNLEVHAASEKQRGSYWDKAGAYAQFVPSVELSYSYGSERSSPASINDSNGDRVTDNTHHRRDRSMSVRQPLIDLAILADIRTGIDKEDIAKIEAIDVRENIASDTVSVFMKLMQARIAVRLAEQYKAYLDDLATRMEARVSGGGGTVADLDRIRSRATVAESAQVEATGDYESNLAEFRRLTKIMPAQLSVPDILAPQPPDSIEAAVKAAVKGNPSYLSSLKKIDVAADDRNKSISTMLPKLSLQYNKNFSYNAGASAQGNPIDGVYPNQLTESFMLVAQWSLNSGTPVTSSLASMARQREMRFRSDDTRGRLEQALRSAFTAINAANQREEIVRKSVQANERVVAGFEDQYRQGGRSLFELLDAYEQLYNSRLNLLRLIVAKAQALYQIRKQMGELIPTILKQARR